MTEHREQTGFDSDALRERYRRERVKRLRADGNAQYVEVTGRFAHFLDDPYTTPIQRKPLIDTVEVVVIGGGFGGLLAGARLREAGVEDSASSRKAATSAERGTGTATPVRSATSSRTSICRCWRNSATSRRRSTATRRKSSLTARRSAATTIFMITPASRPR